MTVLIGLASVGVGWLAWTLTEYVVHRVGFHPASSGAVSRMIAAEHTRHHRDPAHTNLGLRVLGDVGVAVAGLPVAAALSLALGATIGVGAWAGWAGGYVIYETSHWRFHHRAPRNSRGLARRHHHLIHHAVDAASNYGVTVKWWDLVFGTRKHLSSIRVHQTIAPSWLVRRPTSYPALTVTDAAPP